MENIISATIVTGADAIHPGFGFLSRTVNLQSFVSSAILHLSDRIQKSLQVLEINRCKKYNDGSRVFRSFREARNRSTMQRQVQKKPERIGYPVIIKAALGGGGKGMRVPHIHRKSLNLHFRRRRKSPRWHLATVRCILNILWKSKTY